MPVWGQELRKEVLKVNEGAPNPEWQVFGRISALIDYLGTIQVK